MDLDALIKALEHELAGYRRRGLIDRAKAVETELHRLGRSTSSITVDAVPSEPGSSPQEPTRSVRKPSAASKPASAPKTPKKREKP